MKLENIKINIKAMSAATSNDWHSNLEEHKDNPQIEKFVRKTGVKGRYIAGEKQTASDLCVAAGKQILEKKDISRDDVGVVIFVTQSADYRDPSGAMVIQHQLGISTDCLAFDINLGCSGFVCGLGIAGTLLQGANCKYAMLLCGESAAKERDPDSPKFSGNADMMLFGDAGTAILLESNADEGDISVVANSDGNRFDTIIVPYGFYRNPSYPLESKGDVFMDEIGVFNFSTTEVPIQIREFMNMRHTVTEDYDYLVLHQANKYIMDRVVKKTGFTEEQYLISIDRYGNTSSASIPLTIVDRFGDDTQDRKMRMLCCGYGVGLSWATTDFCINTSDVLPVVHTDEYFIDRFGKENKNE